jgi:hypothetical protein
MGQVLEEQGRLAQGRMARGQLAHLHRSSGWGLELVEEQVEGLERQALGRELEPVGQPQRELVQEVAGEQVGQPGLAEMSRQEPTEALEREPVVVGQTAEELEPVVGLEGRTMERPVGLEERMMAWAVELEGQTMGQPVGLAEERTMAEEQTMAEERTMAEVQVEGQKQAPVGRILQQGLRTIVEGLLHIPVVLRRKPGRILLPVVAVVEGRTAELVVEERTAELVVEGRTAELVVVVERTIVEVVVVERTIVEVQVEGRKQAPVGRILLQKGLRTIAEGLRTIVEGLLHILGVLRTIVEGLLHIPGVLRRKPVEAHRRSRRHRRIGR